MALGLRLTLAGGIGWIAAFVLLLEKLELLKDPNYVPSCSINPILSCGSIMRTEQAEVFGFPNPILGVVGFAIVFTVGAATLAGATFARWFWVALLAGCVLAAIFVHWLIFQSLYRIEALCPYCMVVWVVTIFCTWYVALRVIAVLADTRPALARLATGATTYHSTVLVVWYLVITALVAQRFWSYWSTLLS